MDCNDFWWKFHYKPLQLITIHYNPLQTKSILYHNAWISLQLITIHYNSLRFITNKFMFLSTSLSNHYSSLQSITIHYNPLRLTKNGSKSPIKPLPISPSHSRNWTIMELFNKFHYGSTYRGRDVMTIVMDRNEISI